MKDEIRKAIEELTTIKNYYYGVNRGEQIYSKEIDALQLAISKLELLEKAKEGWPEKKKVDFRIGTDYDSAFVSGFNSALDLCLAHHAKDMERIKEFQEIEESNGKEIYQLHEEFNNKEREHSDTINLFRKEIAELQSQLSTLKKKCGKEEIEKVLQGLQLTWDVQIFNHKTKKHWVEHAKVELKGIPAQQLAQSISEYLEKEEV